MSEIRKEYKNGELTVVWKPGLCIHAKECVNALPSVYNPEERPWIKPENATINELKTQINSCPSGALSYYLEGEEKPNGGSVETKVEVLKNGPLLVFGTLRVKEKEGNEEIKNNTTAFCRCGVSKNKPYCDGSHINANFKG